MELLTIKRPSDKDRLSETACSICWQEFAVGDVVAIPACCQKPFDVVELWDYVALTAYDHTHLRCPHCRQDLDAKPLERLYSLEEFPYRPDTEMDLSSERVRRMQNEIIRQLQRENSKAAQLCLLRSGPRVNPKPFGGWLINRIRGRVGQDTFVANLSTPVPWIAASEPRLRLLRQHWERQAPDVHDSLTINAFIQYSRLNDVVWPSRIVELEDTVIVPAEFHIIVPAEFHIIGHNKTTIRGFRRQFYFLTTRQATFADLGRAFLRVLLADMFDEDIPFDRWSVDHIKPFFLFEENGAFESLPWDETIERRQLDRRGKILIQEYESTPMCLGPFWAEIRESLRKMLTWRQEAARLSREVEAAETEQRALKAATSSALVRGIAVDEQLIRNLSRNSEASLSQEPMSISNVQIELARTRVEERRQMLDRIMSPNTSLTRENGNILVHDIVERGVEEVDLLDQGSG